ncbi:MAG: hypothetical protein ACOY4R_23950 [Pseudomonadota bacterium]
MPTTLRFMAAVLLAMLLIAGATAPGRADDVPVTTVAPGQSVVLATRDKEAERLTLRSTNLRGSVVIKESATPPRYSLQYTAPSASAGFTENVVYQAGPTEFTSAVTVAASAFSPDVYEKAFRVLFVAFVVATLLEWGLAVLFNWRPFLLLFDARGVRTVVAVGFAYIFVAAFDLDIVRDLVGAYSGTSPPSGFPSRFISALMLAGGSSGMNKILIALGFREVKTAEEVAPRPPPTVAWISVSLTRDLARGPVDVLIGPAAAPRVAGTIAGASRSAGLFWLLTYFVRDYGRFPTAGGFSVTPGTAVSVQLRGRHKDTGSQISSDVWSAPEGLAAGAIVDLTLKL